MNNVKKLLLTAIALFGASLTSQAQLDQYVRWTYAAKRTSATEATVFIKATIDEGWHIYSQHVVSGPAPTVFTFGPSKAYKLVGKTSEPKPIKKYEKVFAANVTYFENEVVFQQKVRLKSAAATTVTGMLEYMVCNESRCIPPDEIKFSIPVKAAGK